MTLTRRAVAVVAAVLGGALAGGALVGVVAREAAHGNPTWALLAVVVAGSAVLGVIALTRFFGFVLLLLTIRSSVDGILRNASVGSLSVSEAVGVVFLVASVMWLFSARLAGTLHPLSALSKAALGLAATGVVSAPFSLSASHAWPASLKLIALAMMVVVCEQLCRDRPDRVRWLLAACFASTIVPTVVGVTQFFGTRFSDPTISVGRINASFLHPNALATYAGIIVALGVAVRNHLPTAPARWAARTASGFALGLLFFSYARAAWVGCVVAVVFLGVVAERRLLIATVAGLVAVVSFVPSFLSRLQDLGGHQVIRHVPTNSLTWRFGYWPEALATARGRPVFGIGLETLQAVTVEKLEPHNTLLQIYIELGLVGAVAALVLAVVVIGLFRRTLRNPPANPLARAAALGTIAATLGVAAQLVSENLLTAVASLWHLMALLGWLAALDALARPVPGAAPTSTTTEQLAATAGAW